MRDLHSTFSFRQLDQTIFKTNKMHGSYSMRTIKGTKTLNRSIKYRITYFYNKYISGKNIPIMQIVPAIIYQDYEGNDPLADIVRTKCLMWSRIKQNYKKNFYIVGAFWYSEAEIYDLFRGFFYKYQLRHNIELSRDQVGYDSYDRADTSFIGCYDVKNKKWIHFTDYNYNKEIKEAMRNEDL